MFQVDKDTAKLTPEEDKVGIFPWPDPDRAGSRYPTWYISCFF